MKRIIAIVIMAMMLVAPMVAMAEGETFISKTTGLPTDHEYKPVTVQIDNEAKARPQMGIAQADVVYEVELYNGGYTRYTAIFNDSIPTKVEAVRSMRITNLDLHLEWGGMFVHYGGQSYAGRNAFDYSKNKKIVDIEGMSYKDFKRDSSRKAPNNVYCNLQDVQNLKDYTADKDITPLMFSDDYTAKGEDANEFEIAYRKDYLPSYVYNEGEGVYYRYYNGKEFKDGDSGEQITCANIVVQRVKTSWHDGMSDAPVHELTGTGVCDYFIGGKHFTGTWSRDSVDSSTEYYDQDGDHVLFKPGKTYIQIAKDKVELVIKES